MGKYMRVKDAARILGVSTRRIHKAINDGVITGANKPWWKKPRVPVEQVQGILDDREKQSAKAA